MEEAEVENRLEEEMKTRTEKRKQRKKMKRKQIRKEVAAREREIEEARLNDPEELKRLEREQEEEREARERALKEFQDRERAWIEAMESKRLAQEQQQQEEEEEEEKSKKDLEQKSKEEEAEDDDWEYIEEGPAVIIWNGNEITVKKKKVRVPKKDVNQITSKQEDAETERPTSNPLPPQSQVFSDYLNASSDQQVLENVVKQVPNFGTEQDKAHCPFYLKTGACLYGDRCKRAHLYPSITQTLLIKNMFDFSNRQFEQDEQLEDSDEEVERDYEEFYDDVHSEFLKFGEIVNFKVCRNSTPHLRGNVYVHYKSLESAILAYRSINGRYFAKKQVNCEYVNVTKWRAAICGEFRRSRLKTCSHGMKCNFIHCFRNPGGEYEWADKDDPPPKYWQKKMAALFGYSDESGFRKEIEHDRFSQSRNSSKMITWDGGRKRSRRSRSTERECVSSDSDRSCRDNKDDINASTRWKRRRKDDRKHAAVSVGEERRSYRHNNDYQNEISTSDESFSDVDIDMEKDINQVRRRSHVKKTSRNHSEMSDNESKKKGGFEAYSRGDSSDKYGDRPGYHGHSERSSRARSKWEFHENDGDQWNRNRDKETNHSQLQKRRKLPEPGSSFHHMNSRHHSSINSSIKAGSPNEELKSREKYDLDEDGVELERWRPDSPPEEEAATTRSKSRSRKHRHSRSGHRKRSKKAAVSSED